MYGVLSIVAGGAAIVGLVPKSITSPKTPTATMDSAPAAPRGAEAVTVPSVPRGASAKDTP